MSTPIELLELGFGGYLVYTAIAGYRNGEISDVSSSYKFKRDKNAPMFWFNLVTNFIFGVALIVIATGLLSGIFQ